MSHDQGGHQALGHQAGNDRNTFLSQADSLDGQQLVEQPSPKQLRIAGTLVDNSAFFFLWTCRLLLQEFRQFCVCSRNVHVAPAINAKW